MKIKRYFLITLSVLICCSCEKFLDIQRANTESRIQNAKDLQLFLDNTSLNGGFPSDMGISGDDFYVTDQRYLAVSPEERGFYIWNSNTIRGDATAQWQNTYRTIYSANLVIEYAEKFAKEGKEDVIALNNARGAGLFLRAYSHWWIAQLYAKPYSTNTAGQNLGIPLKFTSDINDKSVRGTLEQTYGSILQDLQEAISLLPNTALISSRPSKSAAYAMLARVYLSMENYSQALNNANASLQLYSTLINFNTLSTTSSNPFLRYNAEVLFNSTTINTPMLEPGTTTPGALVNPQLVTSYSTNDLRGKLFIKANAAPNSSTYRFSGNYIGAASSVLFNGLAVDEVYLMRAEAYARAGNTMSAMSDLNTLLRTRWQTGTYVDMTASDSDDALTKILTERRKELLFRGLRWTDLRRLNKDSRFATTLIRTVQGVTYNLPPNDVRYTLLIPTPVIQNGVIEQNPR